MGQRLASPPSRLRCWLRGLWPDRNPLRRTSDRAEAAVVAVLAAALLAGVPLAGLSVARWSYDAGIRAQHAQASWRQVPAVLLNDAETAPVYLGPSSLRRVLANWTAPDGAQRTGRIPAPLSAETGTVLSVWVDSSGRLTSIPLQYRAIERQAALAAGFASAGLALVLLGAAALARRILNRRRLASWDAAWQATGPRWTTQL